MDAYARMGLAPSSSDIGQPAASVPEPSGIEHSDPAASASPHSAAASSTLEHHNTAPSLLSQSAAASSSPALHAPSLLDTRPPSDAAEAGHVDGEGNHRTVRRSASELPASPGASPRASAPAGARPNSAHHAAGLDPGSSTSQRQLADGGHLHINYRKCEQLGLQILPILM